MRKPVAAVPAILALALVLASVATAGLPKAKDTKKIKVPKAIAGVGLKMDIKDADKAWGRRGDCDFKGFKSCVYEGKNPRAGSASIEAARRGKVSSLGIFAGRNRSDEYVFVGKLQRFETKEGIGLGDRGRQVDRAYPKAIKTANRTGYIVAGRGRSYMTFQTFDGKRITGITVVDGRHQG